MFHESFQATSRPRSCTAFKEGRSTVQSSYETKKGWSTEVAIFFLKQEFTEFLVKNREPEIFMIHGPQKSMEDGHLK